MTFEPTRNEQDQFSTRAQRAEVTLTCEVRQNATRPWARVKLHDISATGFRIEWRPGFHEHHPLYLRIPGLEILSAQLRWKREGWIGCSFNHTLYGPTFDHIVRQAQLEA